MSVLSYVSVALDISLVCGKQFENALILRQKNPQK